MKPHLCNPCGLLLLLLTVLIFPQSLRAVEIDGINYSLEESEKTAKVVEKTPEYTGNINVPATIEYSGETYTVTTIGRSAFWNCSGLNSLTMPNTINTIEPSAFSGCTGLTSITIPSSVTSIGISAFSNCTKLEAFLVEQANPNYASLDGVLYNNQLSTIIKFPLGKNVTSYSIPVSVTTIGSSAFDGCQNLKTVVIPNSVTVIDNFAFNNCIGLSSLTIGNSVETIGIWAFGSCVKLTDLIIPGSVTSIGSDAFSQCIALKSLSFDNSPTAIDTRAFSGCSALNTISFGNKLTSIGYCVFSQCESLTSVDIPSSVTSMSNGAFFGSWNLEQINVDSSNPNYTSLDGVLFDKELSQVIIYPPGKNETSYIIPASVKTITERAFYNCIQLRSVTIPGSITELGDWAFAGCAELSSIYYNSENPIAHDGNQFVFTGCPEDATLYVPAVAVDKCKRIYPWGLFRNIVAYDFSGIKEVYTDFNESTPTEIFRLNGEKVSTNTEPLAAGIYIIRKGSAIKKIVVD